MRKVQVSITGLTYSQTRSGAYALILEEKKGQRRLPVIIGVAEAQSIAIQLENLQPYRPLTHDLFVSMAKAFHIEVAEVNIIRLEEGIFYSEILCLKEGCYTKLDARTSDAVAIALRFNAPIFVAEDIMSKASILFDDKTKQDKEENDKKNEDTQTKYEKLSNKELKKLMSKAIESEDYEQATLIRDELNRRKQK